MLKSLPGFRMLAPAFAAGAFQPIIIFGFPRTTGHLHVGAVAAYDLIHIPSFISIGIWNSM